MNHSWTNIGGTDAWIVANSWSTGWGYNGYFFMPVGVNSCGIEADVVTVLAGSQVGSSGTSPLDMSVSGPQAVSVRTKNGVVQDTRNRAYGAPVPLSPQMATQFANQFVTTLNADADDVQHTLDSIQQATSQVVPNKIYGY